MLVRRVLETWSAERIVGGRTQGDNEAGAGAGAGTQGGHSPPFERRIARSTTGPGAPGCRGDSGAVHFRRPTRSHATAGAGCPRGVSRPRIARGAATGIFLQLASVRRAHFHGSGPR